MHVRQLLNRLAHEVGVTAEPDVVSQTLGPRDEVLIIASDGVWEVVSSQVQF